MLKAILQTAVSLKWKFVWLTAVPALLLLCAGCGGLAATGAVSPASFLLPGLLKADPPPVHPDPTLPASGPEEAELAQI
jgi:hypothetical protein